MKILLSAYACEPNRGSEPGVGWHWAIELAKLGHEVWVLTRTNNQVVIEKELSQKLCYNNLNFIYYDLPEWGKRWKKGIRGVHLYYFFWQLGAYRLARKIHFREKFDVVHHVTFVVARQPSFMGRLGIPFIFGPVAGGERAPWRLRFGYGFKGFALDAIRDIWNLWAKFNPLVRTAFRQASQIYVTSNQTLKIVPQSCRIKTKIQLAIGSNTDIQFRKPVTKLKTDHNFRVLYVGRFLYLKGFHLGLPAFAEVAKIYPHFKLTMVGEGPEEKRWRKLCQKLNIADKVEWISWVSPEKLDILYSTHDVFLFPSLRDSGGMVVLEALSHGLPVVCLDLGGPGRIVKKTCGMVILTQGRSRYEVISNIADSLKKIANDKKLIESLHDGAFEQTKKYYWKSMVSLIYSKDTN